MPTTTALFLTCFSRELIVFLAAKSQPIISEMKGREGRRDRERMHFHGELLRLIESPKLQTGSDPTENKGSNTGGAILFVFVFFERR